MKTIKKRKFVKGQNVIIQGRKAKVESVLCDDWYLCVTKDWSSYFNASSIKPDNNLFRSIFSWLIGLKGKPQKPNPIKENIQYPRFEDEQYIPF